MTVGGAEPGMKSFSERHSFLPRPSPLSTFLAMATRRSGRSLRPPLNRDEAMLPLIQRRAREGSEDTCGSYEPGMIAAGYVANAEENNARSDSEADGGPPTGRSPELFADSRLKFLR